MEHYDKMHVFDKVLIAQCWETTGKAHLKARWVDIDKGTRYRSRWVAKQFKGSDSEEGFAAAPPIEGLRALISHTTSGPKKKALMVCDVSWIISRKRCCWKSLKVDVQFSVQRLHGPEVRSKAKAVENCRSLIVPTRTRLQLFRTITSVKQLSLYGAVANMCDRSGQLDVVMGQSIVLSEIKAEGLLEEDDPAYQNFSLQRYEERIKSLSQTDTVSKFCMDAGFLSVVEIGQYFMTKDIGEQFYAKACREYTLPKIDGSSQPKGWIQGNKRIGPVLEITTSCLYGKHGVEIRIWSLSEDNTQSWARISHESNKFVIDSNNNNTESLEDLLEQQASQLKVKDFAARSKANTKPQRR